MGQHSEELHREARAYNWDDGTARLQRILADPQCDRATALLVYWRAKPHYFSRHATAGDVASVNRSGWQFVRALEARLVADEFVRTGIFYDPKDDVGDLTADEYANMGPIVRPIPAALREAVGERTTGSPLVALAAAGDIAAIERAVSAGADPNARDDDRTPLYAAMDAEQRAAVEKLLELGADPNAVVSRSDPLNLAVEYHPWAVPSLLRAGANPNSAKGNYKKKALFVAASRGNADVVAALLEAGATTRGCWFDGASLLMCAAEGGSLEIFELCERKLKRPRYDETDKCGLTLMHYAAKGGNPEIGEIAVAHGVALNPKPLTAFGKTPAMEAAELGRYEMLMWFVERARREGIPLEQLFPGYDDGSAPPMSPTLHALAHMHRNYPSEGKKRCLLALIEWGADPAELDLADVVRLESLELLERVAAGWRAEDARPHRDSPLDVAEKIGWAEGAALLRSL